MQLHFGKRPYDLYLAVGYTLIVSSVVLANGTGNYLAILLVFFVPGYVLTAALFPSKKGIDWIERIVLSFGLSLAVVPLVGLLVSFSSLGVQSGTILTVLTCLTTLVAFAAWWRRSRLPVQERLSATLVFTLLKWKESALWDRALSATLALSVVIAGAILSYVVLSPSSGERFTEFYILGSGENATDYPTNLTLLQPGTVIIGIANHEGMTSTYTVRVDLIAIQIVFNETSGRNETSESNRTTVSWYNVTLRHAERVTQPFTFTIDSVGVWKMQFLLYKDGLFIDPPLQIWIRVS